MARRVHAATIGIVHFDAHADTGAEQWGSLIGHGTPMRRLIESGWVEGQNFVQIGLRGYWPERETFGWMREQRHALAHDDRDRGARRGGGASPTRSPRRSTVPTSSTCPSTSTSSTRASAGHGDAGARRDARRASCSGRSAGSSARVELVGMDVVEVSPPYDQSEITAMLAQRVVLEAISALAAKRRS